MSSIIGRNIKVSIFGQSHAKAVGVCIDGLPAGEMIDEDALREFMQRRAPGKAAYATKRSEADEVEILTGLVDGKTCGAPLMAMICNTDCHSKDYSNLYDCPRPSHADYPAQIKYKGNQDVRGGGHFSGRLTAPLCIAGGIMKQLLKKRGIEIGAHIYNIGGIETPLLDGVSITKEVLFELNQKEFPCFDSEAGKKMLSCIERARLDGDSVGGGIECAILSVPTGLGDGMFGGVENQIASAIFGIPAVKGIEFGNGFGCMNLTGSQNNDAFCVSGDEIKMKTNRHGGVLGGISTGMPIVFRTAIKPTASISKPQTSVSLSEKRECELIIKGRHDPCIVPRAVPCVEAVAAIVIYDMLLQKLD